MAIYDLPKDPNIIISDVDITHYTPQFATTSLSLKRNAKDRGLHQLQGSFKVTIAGERQQKKFESWLLKMRGRLNQFNLKLGGSRFSAESHIASEPVLNQNVDIGNTSISITGFSTEVWEGDFFNLLNDNKVYMFVEDATNAGRVDVIPPIRTTQLSGGLVSMLDVNVLCMLTDDRQQINYNHAGKILEYTCNWEEYV